ncbi:MAG: alpha/beta hydrolase [Armatimonadetes bacterium]|nr:alpha/beta hydrolase [Armatimonadota bacterium]
MTLCSTDGLGRPCSFGVAVGSPRGMVAGTIRGWRHGDPDSHCKLLFLHGVGITLATWRRLLPELAGAADCVTVDLLGFGRSEAARRCDVTMAGQPYWVPQVLDQLGWPRAVLVGHSMGGGVALGTALLHPRRVEGLVPVASVGTTQSEPPIFYVYHVPGSEAMVSATLTLAIRLGLGPLIGRYAACDPVSADDIVRCMARYDVARAFVVAVRDLQPSRYRRYAEHFRLIRQPVLIVHGRYDDIVPPSVPLEMSSRLPDNRVVWVERAAHMPQESHPGLVGEAIRQFLAERIVNGSRSGSSGVQ